MHVAGSLRGVQEKTAADLLGAEEDHPVEHLHGFHDNEVEDRPDFFPQVSLTAGLLPGGSKERTRHPLDLIRQESEEPEHHEDHAQVLLAQSVVVLEMIALVEELVESLNREAFLFSSSRMHCSKARRKPPFQGVFRLPHPCPVPIGVELPVITSGYD